MEALFEMEWYEWLIPPGVILAVLIFTVIVHALDRGPMN
jgi:hypothetical protein